MTKKKTRECEHLKYFKAIYPSFPEGNIEVTESPDFIVQGQIKQIGIEHTEIFQAGEPHGGSLQAQDNLAQQIVDRANILYMEEYSRPLLVQILFSPRRIIHKQDISHIAKMIAHLVGNTPIEPDMQVLLRSTRENADYFPREVARVRIYYRKNGNENRWNCSSAGNIPSLTLEQIQEKINSKEPNIDIYKLKCSEIWLLIVADDFRIPSSVDITESARMYCYTTRFNRVFLFWNSSRSYVELKLANDKKDE